MQLEYSSFVFVIVSMKEYSFNNIKDCDFVIQML